MRNGLEGAPACARRAAAAIGACGFAARLFAVGLLALASGGFAFAQEGPPKRVALVIGNSNYPTAGDLKNPVEDASAMQVALHRLNFKLIVGHDLTFNEFKDKVSEFTKAIRGAEIALFFFAGHGVQLDGKNYLLPSDIDIKSRAGVVAKSIPLDQVLSEMGRSARSSVTFLDACRDSPQWRGLSRNPAKESPGVWDLLTGGFARVNVDEAQDHFIGFAAGPGKTASDGNGKNSPFTTALVNHIAMPDVDIGHMFTFVRGEVLKTTGKRQQPEALSRLAHPVYLNPKQPGGQTEPSGPGGVQPSDEDTTSQDLLVESNLWIGIMDSSDPADFEDYLRKYPEGRFVRLARQRLERMRLAKAGETRPMPPDAHAILDGEFVAAAGSARITKELPREEALRGAFALARARAILARAPAPQANLPSPVRLSSEAAELLGYMNRGFTYVEEAKWQENGNKEVRVELRAKVRALRSEGERRLSGQIEPAEILSGKLFRLRIESKRNANIGVYVWQGDGTMVRLYPDATLKPVIVKAKEPVWFPRDGDPYPGFGAENLHGDKRNHEALIIVTGTGSLPFERLVPTVVAEASQAGSETLVDGHTFLNRLAEIPDPELELLVLPYEVRAGK